MPTFGRCSVDPHIWQACLADTRATMLAAGWNKHARKFTEVLLRRSRKLYRTRAG